MNFRILIFVPLLGALMLAACGPASRTDALLGDIESYINDAPDSARTVLAALDTTELATRRLRARYSLLRTMALDKCYEDISRPGLLDDAAWFERHGTPDERMKLWFYRGRIQSDLLNLSDAAILFSRAEAYADIVEDRHALGLLYLSQQAIYKAAYNWAKAQEYAEKAIDVFKRIGDPLTGTSLGILASIYHGQQEWALADSIYREAMPYFEVIPALAPGYLSDYAVMKLFQPQQDPSGAVALLERCRALTGSFGVSEAGAYAYAMELLGNRKESEMYIPLLRSMTGTDAYSARVWLTRIDYARGNLADAYREQALNNREESAFVQKALEDSVTQALRDDAARQASDARENFRMTLIFAGGIFFALLSVVLLLLLRKNKIKVERDHLIDLREQMQSELEKVQEEKAEQAQLISGQEERIHEMEEHVAREREAYTRERVNRLRQLGELRSTFWWRERGGMREADAIQRVKKEISYVYQTDNDGVTLVRRLDDELDGAVSQLRKRLHLRGKPQEVLFLCCCILDLEPEMIAEIMNISKANVYEKRSRLRARIRELNDPLLSVLVERK